MHESSRRCGTIVRGHHPYSAWTFRYYPLPHAMSYTEVAILEPAHDFCFGTDLVLFACPRYSATSNALNPLFLPLREGSTTGGGGGGGSAELRTLNVQNFPQSDALRVELSCSGNEKYVAFGHRNGQVSLLDLRQSHTTTSILQYYDAGSSSSSSVPNNGMLGSACDLAFLKQSPNQLLVKRSFGSCQLHDLRKSTSNRVPRNVSASSSVVSHLTVPEEGLHRNLVLQLQWFCHRSYQRTILDSSLCQPTTSSMLRNMVSWYWLLGWIKNIGAKQPRTRCHPHGSLPTNYPRG